MPRAEQSLTELRAKYADSALAQVADNISQAKERLAFVQNASATAREKLDAGEGSLAAVAVRAAEESLHQTNVLLDAIAKMAAQPRRGPQRPGVRRRRHLTGPRPGQGHDPVRGPPGACRARWREWKPPWPGSRAEIQGGKIDPIATLERVETAHQPLDAALAGIRDQQEQAAVPRLPCSRASCPPRRRSARTSDYITARRGGVGTEARTRLAEAQRNLDYALSIAGTDPVTALQYAQQAHCAGRSRRPSWPSPTSTSSAASHQGYGGGAECSAAAEAAASAAPSSAAS